MFPVWATLVAGLAAALLLLYRFFTATAGYFESRGIAYLRPTPFFGNIKDLLLMRVSGAEMTLRFYNQLKKHRVGGVFHSRRPCLLVCDPEIVRLFLAKDFASFHDRGMAPVDLKANPLSGHLFNLEGRQWRVLRKKLTPAFTPGRMKGMMQLLLECSGELSEAMATAAESGSCLEIKEVFAQFTTDVIGTCAFGLQFNSLRQEDAEFRRMGRKVFQASAGAVVRRVVMAGLPGLARRLNLKFAADDVSQFFLKVVQDTISHREKHGIVRKDFLQLLIELKNKGRLESDEGEVPSSKNGNITDIDDFIELSDAALAAQAFVFFLAGFETSSTTMSFCVYELALNPGVQRRLLDEIDSVLQRHGGVMSYEAVQEMEYLDRVIQETLRKYPPAANLHRKCTEPYTIPGTGVRLEKGLKVLIPVYGIHHDPEYYPRPDEFDPDRFTEANKARRPGYTYLPYGEGPRICIGMRFGNLQMKAGLATILRHHSFASCERTIMPMVLEPRSFVTAAKGGIWLRIAPRSH
ncbi:probable cytochrome P450 6a14 [Bacillus rossius redtenbacheri]|uniref:probable cytochrome P450 6a14 n=1 Tax=Bacillus rossius redtenbacheri TaxID=93214 RepID=UPI002FDED4D9